MAESRHEWFLNQIFRHRAALYRYLRKLTSRAEDIDDLVQESYLRVYTLPDFEAVRSPRALLFRIAHDMAVERAHRQKSQATGSVGDLQRIAACSLDASADVQLDDRRRFEAFCTAVDQLPPLCRRVFVLRKAYRLSDHDIAEVLGVTHNSIEKHVAKGLVRCRDYLRRAGLLDALQGALPVCAAPACAAPACAAPAVPVKQLRDGGDAE